MAAYEPPDLGPRLQSGSAVAAQATCGVGEKLLPSHQETTTTDELPRLWRKYLHKLVFLAHEGTLGRHLLLFFELFGPEALT